MVPSLPSEVVQALESKINSKVTGYSPAAGGCINNGGSVSTDQGVYFIKWNDANKYPGMFAAEARGLALLATAKSLKVPEVIQIAEVGERQLLVLEHIGSGRRKANYWSDFGAGLAKLHRCSSPFFGLDHHNYIGSLPQNNTASTSWTDFFVEQRLAVQLRLAVDSHRLDVRALGMFERLFERLGNLLPDEPPALLHGDLWGGNIMVTSDGDPCLIDPAVYFGHREADLAMTGLFGGFDSDYLESYRESYPLEPGHMERFDIYNLYPILVHVNLFGGSYGAQALSILRRFV